MQISIDQNTLNQVMQLIELRNLLQTQDPGDRMQTWTRIDEVSSKVAQSVAFAVEGAQRAKAG